MFVCVVLLFVFVVCVYFVVECVVFGFVLFECFVDVCDNLCLKIVFVVFYDECCVCCVVLNDVVVFVIYV